MEHPYPKAYFYRRIVLAKRFLDAHYADPIDLDVVAAEAAFSKFHFLRQFKKAFGKTPHQYLIAVRIAHAKRLLQAGLPVSDVCLAVGFESLTSFSGLFKRLVGLAPSAYWAQQQARQVAVRTAPLQFVPGCFAEKAGWTQNRNFQEVQ